MEPRTVHAVLLAALVVAVAFVWGLRTDPTVPNKQFIPQMHYSIPFDPQSANPNFEDGKTLRTPVSGTIARDMLPLHYGATPEEAERAGRELKNPLTEDPTSYRERGSVLYARFCQPCHGPAGMGDGLVTKYGFPPPPSLMTDKARSLKDGRIFHILTHGQGNMPGLAVQIEREDRWVLVHAVRELQRMQARMPAGGENTTMGQGMDAP